MANILSNLYARSPIWAQSALLSAYGLVLRRRRYGRAFKDELSRLERSQWFDKSQLDELQNAALRRILTTAMRQVPHYRQHAAFKAADSARLTISNVHEHLPCLTKSEVRANPQSFVAEDGGSEKRTTIFTSGTSGSPLPVVASTKAIQTNYAFFARYLGWHGVSPTQHGATFAGRLIVPKDQDTPPFWRHNRAMDTLLCSSYHLSERWLNEYVAALSDFSPDFIDSYPSAVVTVARHINVHRMSHSIRPKVVITSSETLLPSQRAHIEEAFGCKVRDHYGCAEMAALITECEKGSYHVNPEFGLIEILRPDGSPCDVEEDGDLCCTGFVNSSMPLIRYMIGDRARWSANQCECGRHFPVVAALLGRADDSIVTPDGRTVGRLDPAFKGGSGIVEAQIVQRTLDTVEVLLVRGPGYNDSVATQLQQDLQHRLGPQMTITITPVAAIPRQPNGKFKSVVSLVK